MPVCDAGEPARAYIASDESTEADSGAEESPPAPRAATGGSGPNGGTASGRGAGLCGIGRDPGAAPPWQLIWCHERCHKQDCDEKRAAIASAAGEARAGLLCFKKAAKYAAWLEQAQWPPHALLTDWREVKPCLQAAAHCPPRSQPVFTVVLCELPKHYERASAWAQALPARHDPVRVSRGVGLLEGLLQELAGQLLAGALARPRPGASRRPPGQFHSVARPFPQYAITQATGYGVAAWTTDAEDDVEKEFESIRKQRDSMWLRPVQAAPGPVSAWDVTVRSSPVAPGISGGMDQCGYMQVQSVAAPQSLSLHVDLSEDSQLLEAMLMSAMPDHYDD